MKIRDILRKAQQGPELIQAEYKIGGFDKDEQLVYGQVYSPDTLDSHGHYMTASELRQVAHRFMVDGLGTSIDVMHDNILVDATIVESFIARKGDPDYEEGSWVAVTKIHDQGVWERVKNGELNGYSFEILTYSSDVVVEYEFETWHYGFTDPHPSDKHTHPFMVRLGDDGEIAWGRTGVGSDGSPGHYIKSSNITSAAAGHTHRLQLKGNRA